MRSFTFSSTTLSLLILLLGLFSQDAHAGLGFGDPRPAGSIEFQFSSDKARTVTFLSGVPLTGAGDNNGGFGDVAANVTESIRYAEQNPGAAVTLVVISTGALENRAGVAQSSDIVKIMIPELNPNLKDVVQKARGISVIFFSKSVSDRSAPDYFSKVIPRADTAIVLSTTKILEEFLERAGEVNLQFKEPNGSQNPFSAIDRQKDNRPSITLTLETGAKGAGYYLTGEQNRVGATNGNQKLRIAQELAKAQVVVPSNVVNASWSFSYTKEKHSTDHYVEAIGLLASSGDQSGKQHVVFVKDFGERYQSLPRNVTVVYLKGIPSSTMEGLIQSCDLAPMVTGDGSLSVALASAKGDRGILYEMNPWKVGAQSILSEELSRSAGLDAADAQTLRAALEIPAGSPIGPQEMAVLISNKDLWSRVNPIIAEKLPSWSVVNNMGKLDQLARLMKWDFMNSTKNIKAIEIIVDLVVRTPTLDEAVAACVQIVANSRDIDQVNGAALLLSRRLESPNVRAALTRYFESDFAKPDLLRGALREPSFQKFVIESLRNADSKVAKSVAIFLKEVEDNGNPVDAKIIEDIRNGRAEALRVTECVRLEALAG